MNKINHEIERQKDDTHVVGIIRFVLLCTYYFSDHDDNNDNNINDDDNISMAKAKGLKSK